MAKVPVVVVAGAVRSAKWLEAWRSSYWRAGCVVAMASMLATGPELAARVVHLTALLPSDSGLLAAATFAFIWAASMAAIVAMCLGSPLWVRAAWAALSFASSLTVLAYHTIMHEPLEVLQFQRTLSAVQETAEALQEFSGSMLLAGLLAVPQAAAIVWVRERRAGQAPARAVPMLAPLLPVGLIAAVCWLRGGEGTSGLPAGLRPTAYTAALIADGVVNAVAPPRIRVAATADPAAAFDKIVIVMDESVVSDVFDERSSVHIDPDFGKLAAIRYDLGPAASGSNCSRDSNLVFRVGPREAHITSDLSIYPSMWEYAQRAGYRTVYIDEQNQRQMLTNGMTEWERSFIAQVIKAGATPADARDSEAGKLVAELLKQRGRHFIYVNKVGAHFPWDSKYPPKYSVYRPTLGMRGNGFSAHMDAQPAGLFASAADLADSEAFKNSYRNAVEWNMNSFFAQLQSVSWGERMVLIYTSDHGQNLFREGGHTNTHCSTHIEAARAEGRVPLMVFTASHEWQIRLRASEANAGRLSHFNVFASLVAFMGFPDDGRPDARDPPLWGADPSPAGLRTAVGVNVHFGAKVPWLPLCAPGERLANDGSCYASTLASPPLQGSGGGLSGGRQQRH